jgi:hypothetical protein
MSLFARFKNTIPFRQMIHLFCKLPYWIHPIKALYRIPLPDPPIIPMKTMKIPGKSPNIDEIIHLIAIHLFGQDAFIDHFFSNGGRFSFPRIFCFSAIYFFMFYASISLARNGVYLFMRLCGRKTG